MSSHNKHQAKWGFCFGGFFWAQIHTPGKRDHMGVGGSLLEHRLYMGIRIEGSPKHTVYKRPPSVQQTHTDGKWGKRKSKESKSDNNHIRQNRLKNKDHGKRQGRTLHNDQGTNPRRGYDSCELSCTQHRSAPVHEADANSHESGNRELTQWWRAL